MAYPADSAGSLMDPRVSAFRVGTTVGEAVAVLRTKRPPELGSVYLIDADDQLVGAVALGELATAAESDRLAELAKFPASTNAFATREEIVDFLSQQRLASLPVVDIHGRLIGVIRNQTLIAATEQEASADIQTTFGVSKDERALSRVPFAVRQRLPWLQINLATAFFAAFIVGLFQDTIARVTALAVLMPVVAGESGNSGMQAVAVTLRGLALREVNLRHWPRLVAKETGVGFLNGVAVALVTALGVFFWSQSLALSLVIAGSMLISLVIAGISGTSIPMLLKALGQDPAQSSSIFLTTITCAIGLLSFLGLASIFIVFLSDVH
jgi:magnesium transporter